MSIAPGPWSIGTGPDHGYILDADEERVCRVTNDPTSSANARAIAMLPTLIQFVGSLIDSGKITDQPTIMLLKIMEDA